MVEIFGNPYAHGGRTSIDVMPLYAICILVFIILPKSIGMTYAQFEAMDKKSGLEIRG